MAHTNPRPATIFTLLAFALAALAPIATAGVFFVDHFSDSASATACTLFTANDCSLRGAVIRANLTTEHDEIWLFPGTYSLSIGGTGEDQALTGDLDVRYDVTFVGHPAGSTIIDAGGIDRVLDIHDSPVVTVSRVTLQAGYVDGFNGGGIRMIADPTATLHLLNSTVKDNSAFGGGGICSTGVLNIMASTITNNTAESRGGGIFNFGELDLTDSRLGLGNEAADGGGIYNSGNPCRILRSEIYGNTVSVDGAGIYNANGMRLTNCSLFLNFALTGSGGAIRNDHYLVVENVTITGNVAAGNLSSAIFNDTDSDLMLSETLIQGTCVANPTVVSYGGNLESPGAGCGLGDQTDQVNVGDPMLGTIDFHGGMTRTVSLEAGSLAIDCGKEPWEPDDQRGRPRPFDGDDSGTAVADAGAYEYNPAELLIDGFESGDTSAW